MFRREFFKRVLGAVAAVLAPPLLAVVPGARVPRRPYHDVQLTKKEWMELDNAILAASRKAMRKWADTAVADKRKLLPSDT